MPVIHNRGRKIGEKSTARKIIYPKDWDQNGDPVKDGKKIISETLMPGQHKTVTDAQYVHLKANFSDEIVNVDDMKDLQAQFKPQEPEKPREGYLSPEEVEKRVQEGVDKALKKHQRDSAKEAYVNPELLPEPPETGGDEQSREDFILSLDAMDRGDLIALIEKRDLKIDHKRYKAPAALKSAILAAADAQKEEIAETEAE